MIWFLFLFCPLLLVFFVKIFLLGMFLLEVQSLRKELELLLEK